MTFSLVLGGGGVIGVAWESGLCAGLLEAGFDPRTADVIVGTSAGAIVGTQLALGRMPGNQERAPTQEGRPGQEEAPKVSQSLPIDPQKLDPKVLGQVFTLWGAMKETTAEQAAAIGKLAREVNREGEAGWVSAITSGVGQDTWPERPLLINAVDTESGERRTFDARSGAELGRAIAASSAVPGLMPSVTIGTRRYMDGQVHSCTNADALLAQRPSRILIAMPTNSNTSRGIGRHAERMLELELAALEAAGAAVSVRAPSASDAATFGPNLMDPRRAADAYAVGLETGRAWASELR
jgi:NTE family protein